MNKFTFTIIAFALSLQNSGALAYSIPCSPADKELLPSTLTGSVNINGQRIQITVKVPDKEYLERCSVDALEFGDNIHFIFNEAAAVVTTVSVAPPIGLRPIQRELKTTSISLQSTVLADERELYPYHVRVNDRAAGMVFDLYLNKSSRVAFTRAYRKLSSNSAHF